MTTTQHVPTQTWLAGVAFLGIAAAAPAQGDGPRMYWKTLADSTAVTFWKIDASGNTNPFDKAHVVQPSGSFEADLAILGYHRTLDLFGQSATASVLLPVGSLDGELAGSLLTEQASASGYGDPTLQLDYNLIGAPAMNDLPSLLRYEPRFTLDLLVSVAVPIGEYDPDETLNLGQNRWYGRLGAPMMLTIGPWVPGQRTTLELLPAVWVYGDNTDYQGTKTLETDPMFALEGHLTRDLTESAWSSLDAAWFQGAKSEVDGLQGEAVDNLGVGVTFGFQVTDNLSVNLSYFTTIDDNDDGDLRGDEFRLMFTYGWHQLLEGMHRLSGK
ncbi:MAG TPA: transporter [Planctomycetota bacterium]